MKNLPVAIPETAQGRIITSVGGLYTVETFSGICTCKARGIFRKRGITPYVGDYVQLSEDGVIQEILPPDVIAIEIEKNLEKGFDYRKITISDPEEKKAQL